MGKTLSQLILQIRREVRDEGSVQVFSDVELTDYISTAVRAYSQEIPREIIGDLELSAGVAEYAMPAGCREVCSIKAGAMAYIVTDIFGGMMAISPAPSLSAAAKIRYKGCHAAPTEDATGSYDDIDEPLIVKHVRAQCLESLAGDGARYYKYTEGDVEEDQGQTQKQFRAEADALYAEFRSGVAASKAAFFERRPVTCTPTLGVVARKPAVRGGSVYR